MNEQPLVFKSAEGFPLVGMLHQADCLLPTVGVLVMVAGGPQYRIGGHRQLVYWAREFAGKGYPVFRFDFSGMGDSYGDYAGFEDAERDIRAAIDCFVAAVPSLTHIVLWGECNACSASLFYAYKDARVKGIVMLNPWVRTEEGQAKAVVKHYYLQRIRERSFWRKVFSLKFDILSSFRSALQQISKARGSGKPCGSTPGDEVLGGSVPDRMLAGLSRFGGRVMLVLSGRDMVAKEFDDVLAGQPEWRSQLQLKGTVRHDLEFGDHTFSSGEWRDQVAAWGCAWLLNLKQSLN